MSDDKAKDTQRAKGAASAEILGTNTEIGRKLRQYYDGLVSEDVPDRFAELLRQLDKAETTEKPE
jgi:hypothetical protein